jgi:hypothetical protein
MINVAEDNCQIDANESIDNTSTSSCCNNEFCLVSFLKDNVCITDSDCSHHMTDDK